MMDSKVKEEGSMEDSTVVVTMFRESCSSQESVKSTDSCDGKSDLVRSTSHPMVDCREQRLTTKLPIELLYKQPQVVGTSDYDDEFRAIIDSYPSGNRSGKDLKAVRFKIAHVKALSKKALKREFDLASKMRGKQRAKEREAKLLATPPENMWLECQDNSKEEKIATKFRRRYAYELREMNKRKREKRQIQTESGEIEVMTPFQAYQDCVKRTVYADMSRAVTKIFKERSDWVRLMYRIFWHAAVWRETSETGRHLLVINFLEEYKIIYSPHIQVLMMSFYALKFGKNLVRRLKSEEIHTEAKMSEFLDGLASDVSLVFDSEVCDAFKNIVVICISTQMFTPEFANNVTKWTGKIDRKMSYPDMALTIMNVLSKLTRAFELWQEGLPFSDVFMSRSPVHAALAESSHLLMKGERLYYGLPVEGKFCAREFVSVARNHVSIMDRLVHRVNPKSQKAKSLVADRMMLNTAVMNARRRVETCRRVQPYAIILVSPPGVGKSSLIDNFFKVMSLVKGREFQHSHVFHMVRGSPYFDGYDTYETPYVHMSEVASQSNNLLKAKGDDALPLLLSMIDNQTMILNMSDVADKGKMTFNAEMVVADTNDESLQLQWSVNCTSAVRRRFLWVRPMVRSELTKEGTSMLDPDKVDRERIMDNWKFEVWKEHPDGRHPMKTNKYPVANGYMDIEQLNQYLYDDVTQHIKLQTDISQELEAYVPHVRGHEEIKSDIETDSESDEELVFDQEVDNEAESFSHDASVSFFQLVLFIVSLMRSNVECMFMYLRYRTTLLMIDGFQQAPMLFLGVSISCIVGALIYMQQFFTLFLLFTLVMLIDLRSFALCSLKSFARHKMRMHADVAFNKISELNSLAMGRYIRPIAKYKWIRECLAIVAAASFLTVIYTTFFSRKHSKVGDGNEAESTQFRESSTHDDKLNHWETKVGASKSYERVNVKGTQVWNTRILTPSVSRNSVEATLSFVMRNVRKVEIVQQDTTSFTHILGVRGNVFIINRHSVPMQSGDFVMRVHHLGQLGGSRDFRLSTESFIPVVSDIVAVKLEGLRVSDIVKHFPCEVVDIRRADGMILGSPITITSHKGVLEVKNSFFGQMEFEPAIQYEWDNHSKGKCGLPIVAQRDSGCCIVGIHSAGSVSTDAAYGIVVTRGKIESALTEVETQTLIIYSEPDLPEGLGEPCAKSPFRYEHLPNLEYYGSLGPALVNQRSRLEKSKCKESLQILTRHFGQRENEYAIPIMKPFINGQGEYISPYNMTLRKMNKQRRPLDLQLCKRIENEIYDRISALDVVLQPLDVETAVNGAAYDEFLRRMDMSKAAGFGTPGSKKDYTTRYEDEINEVYDEVDYRVREEILQIVQCYSERKSYGPVFKATLKDEPREQSRVNKGATRIFYSTPLSFLIVQRMFLAPFYTLVVEHGDLFMTAIGINMHTQAAKIPRKFQKYRDRVIEGDFSGYDVSMPYEVKYHVNSLICRFLRAKGYNDEAMVMVHGLLTDLLHPMVYMINDLFSLPGLQPSGKYATAEDNSLCTLFISMYIYYQHDAQGNFFEDCELVSYGDDLLMASENETFTPKVYAHLCELHTGLGFTTASKGEACEYVTLDTMTFLKRTFCEENGQWWAPLASDSLYKTLEWIIPSKIVNEFDQYVSIFSSTLREVFIHRSRQLFETLRASFEREVPGCTEYLPQWEEICKDLCPSSCEGVCGGRRSLLINKNVEQCDRIAEKMKSYHEEQKSFGRLDDPELQWPTKEEIFTESDMVSQGSNFQDYKQDETVGDQPGLNFETTGETPLYPVSTGLNETAHLKDFLKRPILLQSSEWVLFNDFSDEINVWELFMNEPSVRAKLRNFAYIRGDLVLRISASGSPFHYGKILVSYQPLSDGNMNIIAMRNYLATPLRQNALNYLSQSRDTLVIDARDNAPVEIRCPFICPQPMIRLYGSGTLPLPATSSFPDTVGLGSVFVESINPLQTASAGATNVSLSFYYWMENVELGVPTGSQLDITTESDERKTGPIERMATRAQEIAARLRDVPIIGRYAQASEMALGAVSSISSAFGYSYPVSIRDPNFVKNRPYANGMNCIGLDTGMRMTYDPQQELMVDPAIGGTNEDEMSLAFLCKTESYLTTFTWSDRDVSMAGSILKLPVYPQLSTYTEITLDNYVITPTALAFASSFFEYWRGDIDFRFEIVCSAFHRGKLAIVYEPNVSQHAIITSFTSLNKQYVKIVDIQDTRDVCYTVKWARPKPWSRSPTTDEIVGREDLSSLEDFANGFIYVTPFTELQSPDGSSVKINVYVRSRDMAFNRITTVHLPDTRVNVDPGGFLQAPNDVRTESDTVTTVPVLCDTLNESGATMDHISEVCFGEQPASLRGILKRFANGDTTAERIVTGTWNFGQYVAWGRRSIYPPIRPVYDGVTLDEQARHTFLPHIRLAYLCMRGGMRYRISMTGADQGHSDSVLVQLKEEEFGESVISNVFTPPQTMYPSAEGTVEFMPATNGGVEVELPQYTRNLFAMSCNNEVYPSTNPAFDLVATRNFNFWYPTASKFVGSSSRTIVPLVSYATGDDFQLFRYQGAPSYAKDFS